MNGGPELDPKLKDLLDEAGRSSDFPEERREALFARVAASLPGSSATVTSATAAATRLPARIAKAAALVLLGGAIGYALGRSPSSSSLSPFPSVRRELPPPRPQMEAPREPAVAIVSATSTTMPPSAGRTSASPRVPSIGPTVEPAPPSTNADGPSRGIDSIRTTLGEERRLVERGRAAIARRDAVSALEVLSEHERAFPSGVLAEERDALRIQALALAGRAADARRRAREFTERHPNSVFASRVEETLGALPP